MKSHNIKIYHTPSHISKYTWHFIKSHTFLPYFIQPVYFLSILPFSSTQRPEKETHIYHYFAAKKKRNKEVLAPSRKCTSLVRSPLIRTQESFPLVFCFKSTPGFISLHCVFLFGLFIRYNRCVNKLRTMLRNLLISC